MDPHPARIDGARVLAVVHITPPVTARGTTLHRVNDEVVGPFAALAIAQYEEDENVYLFYCDQQWNVITDICRDSVDAAKGQAAFEYDGINACWYDVE